MFFSEKQLRVLEQLGVYRYLTVRQMLQLGIGKTEKEIRDKVLSLLKAKPHALIQSVDFGFIAGVGRLPQIHHLTKRGALALADLHSIGLDSIQYPIGAVQFSRDYFHRLEFISLHIALRNYAETTGQTLEFFHSYFDSTGNQRQANSQLIRDTQVQLKETVIIPDGNFRLAMLDGQTRLFTLELHKGNNTKKILAQLENHAFIIENELLADKYQHPFDNYVLSVYDHQGTLEAVKRRFYESQTLKAYTAHFAFSLWDTVQVRFADGWHKADGQPLRLFS